MLTVPKVFTNVKLSFLKNKFITYIKPKSYYYF